MRRRKPANGQSTIVVRGGLRRRLRILLLTPALPPAPAGNARQAARLQRFLAQQGVLVRLVSCRLPPGELEALCKRLTPDLIWGLHLTKSGPAAARLAEFCGVPYGLTVTGTDVNSGPPEKPGAVRLAIRGAAAIVAPDRQYLPALRRLRRGGIAPPRLRVIAPGVELAPGLQRQRLTGGVIMWLGGLRRVKAPGWALPAFARLKRDFPAAQFHFAGPVLERAAAAPILRAAANSGSGVRYLGPLSWRRAQAQMARAALLTNTSDAEALPHALGEAILLGVPVVARAIPGNRPYLRPHGPGIGVISPAGWKQAVRAILRNPSAVRPVSRALALRLSPQREARAYAALFKTLAGKQK